MLAWNSIHNYYRNYFVHYLQTFNPVLFRYNCCSVNFIKKNNNCRLLATGGILNNSLSTVSPMKGVGMGIRPVLSAGVIPLRQSPQIMLGNTNPGTRGSMCQLCMTGYEREMGKLVAEQFEKSSSASATTVSKADLGQGLPHWLQLGPGQTAQSGSPNSPVQVS